MRLHLVSDTHFETYKDQGHDLVHQIRALQEREPADVLVAAGDIGTARYPDQLRRFFEVLAPHYAGIVYVPGNHEYYLTDYKQAWHNIRLAAGTLPNVHPLNRESVVILGKTFHGHTMWFRDTVAARIHTSFINDFTYIRDITKWVYEENGLWQHYLAGNLRPGDVVVTHHLPSHLSVDPIWAKAITNCYFVCEQDALIRAHEPALWMHGHTHTDTDYVLGKTRVVCNPRGYPRERSRTYMPKVVELP
jgi:predicted phosphodiesterase